MDTFPVGYDVQTDVDTPKRRARRQFTDEFRAGVVRLVLEDGKNASVVAPDSDLTETAVREWVTRV